MPVGSHSQDKWYPSGVDNWKTLTVTAEMMITVTTAPSALTTQLVETANMCDSSA